MRIPRKKKKRVKKFWIKYLLDNPDFQETIEYLSRLEDN